MKVSLHAPQLATQHLSGDTSRMTSHADAASTSRQNSAPPLWFSLLLGVVVCMGAAYQLRSISRDGAGFVRFAIGLQESTTEYLTGERSQPGFPLILLAASRTIAPRAADLTPTQWVVIGQLISSLGYCACIALIFLITRRLFDDTTARIAAFLAACWPQAAQIAGDVLSDLPHLALYLATILLVLRLLNRCEWYIAITAGLLASVAYLIRQEALALPLAAMILICLPDAARQFPATVTRRATGALLLLITFATPLIPYMIITGRIGEKQLHELLPFSKEIETAAVERDSPSSYARATLDPSISGPRSPITARFTADVPLKMIDAWARAGRYIFSTLFVVGWWLDRNRTVPTARRLLLLLVALHCAAVAARGSSFGIVSSRYMMVPVALTLPWSAAGLIALLGRATSGLSTGRQRITTIVVLLVTAAPLLTYAWMPNNANDGPLRRIGTALHKLDTQNRWILTNRRLSPLCFYAGARWAPWDGDAWTLDVIQARDEIVHADWYIHLERDTELDATEPPVINEIIHCDRWPNAIRHSVEQYDDDRVTIIRLRPAAHRSP